MYLADKASSTATASPATKAETEQASLSATIRGCSLCSRAFLIRASVFATSSCMGGSSVRREVPAVTKLAAMEPATKGARFEREQSLRQATQTAWVNPVPPGPPHDNQSGLVSYHGLRLDLHFPAGVEEGGYDDHARAGRVGRKNSPWTNPTASRRRPM